MKKIKHRNIPIFIPHMGCPNMCVFCNQRSISGRQSFDRESVRKEIETALSTIPADCEVEIAYFGGSFTGIDRELMIYLLDVAQSYIDSPVCGRAKISGIRMSTRPDYINGEIMEILSHYSVSTVELGLQSMDDEVLSASKRGHTAADAEAACKMIKDAGYSLIGQMMIGLPKSTPESEVYTAEKICEMGADGARIYPTVVFYETELAEMAERGAYEMLSLDLAVSRSCSALEVFEREGVECIRIGLCASDNLGDAEKVMGGANHSAMGELVIGELYYRKIKRIIEKHFSENQMESLLQRRLRVAVPRGELSKAIGQRGKNRERLVAEFSLSSLDFYENDTDEIKLTDIF